MMYTAVGNQIFVHGELFITIHPTNTTISVEEQAKIIVGILNDLTWTECKRFGGK